MEKQQKFAATVAIAAIILGYAVLLLGW
jgi:hypothetical protein